MEKFLQKLEKKTDKKYILYVLGGVAFLESIIFPIPVDIFTFGLASVHRKKWFRFGLVATIFSVLGALGGYALGYYLFESFGQRLIDFYHYQKEFNSVVSLFHHNTFIVMFTSAFTPIPFKVFTIAGGVARVSLLPFFVSSFLGRGLRFFAEVYLAHKYGKQITLHIVKKFNFYSVLLVILVVLYFFVKNLL